MVQDNPELFTIWDFRIIMNSRPRNMLLYSLNFPWNENAGNNISGCTRTNNIPNPHGTSYQDGPPGYRHCSNPYINLMRTSLYARLLTPPCWTSWMLSIRIILITTARMVVPRNLISRLDMSNLCWNITLET